MIKNCKLICDVFLPSFGFIEKAKLLDPISVNFKGQKFV